MLLLCLLVAAAVAAEEPNWPQWQGPHHNGVSSEKGLPLEWSATKNVLWKTAIEGRGHSSTVVWGDRVFVTTDIEGERIEGASAPTHILRPALSPRRFAPLRRRRPRALMRARG